jgi:hypothetical protein
MGTLIHVDTTEVLSLVRVLRDKLESAFSPETAAGKVSEPCPSAGHCAAAALIVQRKLGGELVSSMVDGQSHWFNRIKIGEHTVDIDLTGDQFGFEPIQLSVDKELYPRTRVRTLSEVNEETLRRSKRLEHTAGL